MTIRLLYTHVSEDEYGDFIEKARQLAAEFGAEVCIEDVSDVE